MSARNEPPDQLDLLQDERAELVRAMAETGYHRERPRLRDRNGFFNALLHGERDTLEKVRPRWREYQRNAKRATELTTRIESLVAAKVAAEPGYRALEAETDREAKARHSCRQLLDAIRAARARITRAETTTAADSSRAVVKREIDGVSGRLGQVRRHVDEVRANLTGGRGFHPGEQAGLRLEYSRGTGPKELSRKLTEIGALLGSLERTVVTLLGEVSARESACRARQRRYLADGRARYLR